MFHISCFADEVSPDLGEQLKFVKDHRIQYISLRSMWDTNVLNLTDEQLDTIMDALTKDGVQLSSIGSPIGKSDICDESGSYLEQTRRAVKICQRTGCKRIRIFSFYMNKDDLDIYRNEVVARICRMMDLTVPYGITLLHENEAGIYGESSERSADLLHTIDSDNFKVAFDPSNFVAAGEKPFEDSFMRLKPYVDYFHIKDSRRSDGIITPAGEGDGQIVQLLNAVKEQDLFLTLEPHLAQAGKFRGFTGADLFDKAYKALTGILDDQHLSYR